MSLFDIKKKLYQKEPDQDLSRHGSSSFDIRTGGVNPSDKFKAQEKWGEDDPLIGKEQNKSIKWGALSLVGILALALLVVGVLKFAQSSFNESRVTVAIDGPKEGGSGKLLSYVVTYKNDNRVTLKNTVLRMSFPESFKPEMGDDFKKEGNTGGTVEIGEVKGGGIGQFVLKGRAYNPKGTLIYIKANLAYAPSNFNSQFNVENQIGINVTSTPIELEVLAPQDIANGDAVDYLISYKNIGQEDFENIRIRMDYPDGFTFGRANPSVSEGNNTWYIGHLSAGQGGKIVVSGKLEGARDDVKNVQAYIGIINQGEFFTYNEEKAETRIAASPLVISQLVNGLDNLNVKAGDTLRFVISYKNESNIGFRDAIITEKLDSPVLDYASLRLDQGAFDLNKKIITWKAGDFSNLKFLNPGQGGAVRFSIKVKDVVPVAGENDKNFVISSLAKIDSPDIPTPIKSNKIIAGNEMDMRLNSKLILDVKGFYNDTVIGNSGPLPPQVGKETTYTIHWIAANVSNDVANAKIETVLPTGVTMTGKISPEDSHLTYNERNNTVTWEMGNISAGTGIISAPKEVDFQIKFIPSPDQGGASSADILGPSVFTGKDLFTDDDLTTIFEKKTTILREDTGMGMNAYNILPAS